MRSLRPDHGFPEVLTVVFFFAVVVLGVDFLAVDFAGSAVFFDVLAPPRLVRSRTWIIDDSFLVSR